MRKRLAAVVGISMVLLLSGCANKDSVNLEKGVSAPVDTVTEQEESGLSDVEHIASLYRDIYENAQQSTTLGDLEVTRNFVRRLGEYGYAVVDENNQIDMANPQQVVDFYNMTAKKETAELTLIMVIDSGGFIQYDFLSKDGVVEVERGYYQYVDGKLENINRAAYIAQDWQYTQEGYLVFEGDFYSDSYHALVASDATEHVAVRVEPLPDRCRELNRDYLLPAGYGKNNLFLADWDETDYGTLNFYDVFDKFYPDVYQRLVPYVADGNVNAETVYQIPADTFERVIGRYFKIETGVLRQKTIYNPEGETYEYRPKGLYESDYADVPYPEVVDYQDNSDGTITLTVNAVYPEENTSRAFTHETVVRLLEDGSFQYVSNQVVYPEDNYDAWWHAGRMDQKQWEETYSSAAHIDENCGSGEYSSVYTDEDGSLLSETEKKKLKEEVITAVRQAEEVYEDADVEEDLIYGHIVKDFSREQRNKVVCLLGEAGYVSVTEDANMQNPEAVQDFYDAYQNRQDAMVTVFDVRTNGTIGACTFVYRAGKLQTCYVQIAWQEGGIPEITSAEVSDLQQIKLTEKGYFIYAYEYVPYHSSLRQYWRVSPLSDACRELTERYVHGISYVNYNAFVKNWDESNAEDILMPCMFEDIYRIDTGNRIQPKNGEIPAKTYEKIMTTYFPVTVEQVREKCGYQADTDSYPYEMIFSRQYPPFGEVVDYVENPDQTITLMVDGVWPDYDSDCAFTGRITVEPHDDGTFRYLSNSIEKGELDIPVVEP